MFKMYKKKLKCQERTYAKNAEDCNCFETSSRTCLKQKITCRFKNRNQQPLECNLTASISLKVRYKLWSE